MAELLLFERCESEEDRVALERELRPVGMVQLEIEDDPFAGTEFEGMAPNWAVR